MYVPLEDIGREMIQREVWGAMLSGRAILEANNDSVFEFAARDQATVKVDAEALAGYQRMVVIHRMAWHLIVRHADVIVYVPDGMKETTTEVGRIAGRQVAHLERVLGGERREFRFASDEDEAQAHSADNVAILEDVVTTGSSIASVAELLRPGQQVITSLSMLLRGEVDPDTTKLLKEQAFLAQRYIPLDKEEFKASLNDWERGLYVPGTKR